MSKSKDSDSFDSFWLLGEARIETTGVNVFNGGGSTIDSGDDFEYTTQNLYYKHEDYDTPVALAINSTCGGEEIRWPLTDGVDRQHDGCVGDYYDLEYVETIAITQRADVSKAPIALIDYVGIRDDCYDCGYEWITFDYSPIVVLFDNEVGTKWGWWGSGLTIYEKRREEVTGKNNDYWEGVFQYDINKDGSVPDYIPSEYPLVSGSSEDVNGKTIKGTKKRDVLNGRKKDDYINGKKGDDAIDGKKGNDVLLGFKGYDSLSGSQGDDYLNGGEGNDVLKGGGGADIFTLSKGNDTIVDFDITQGDKIAIPEEYIYDFTIAPKGLFTFIIVDGYGDILLSGIESSFVEMNIADILVRHS